MPLVLHRADRADALVEGLAGLLATPPDDPFARDVVVVAATGVERWLAQRLSHRLGSSEAAGAGGICAGVDFLRPRHLITEVAGRVDDDPWSPSRLTWSVLAILDAELDEPWLRVVADHLGHDLPDDERLLRRSRRYSTARRTAGLLHGYALQRPWMVEAWRAGEDVDGAGSALPEECRWQAELFRRLGQELGPQPAPDQRLARAAALWRSGEVVADVPDRLSLFGHTRMPWAELDVVCALGAHREVHLWLPHPSRERWEHRAPSATIPNALAGTLARPRRRSEHRRETTGNRFLASCARDVDELQAALTSVAGRVDHLPTAERPLTLLGRLQHDLVRDADESPGLARAAAPSVEDRSVQIHACHGPARQVEVLREVVVGLLQDDPGLEPRDIVVMCPDVETFAPHIEAAFGSRSTVATGHPGHGLRVRLADRSAASVNPVADALRRVVAILAGGRGTATQIRDLLSLGPVRRRFGLTDDDLEQLDAWMLETAVRWGLDSRSRARWGLDGLAANTWRAGLDRLALGVATDLDGPRPSQVLPVDDLSSTQIALVGRVTEAVSRLVHIDERAEGPLALPGWCDLLDHAVEALTDTPPAESWQCEQVHRLIGELRTSGAAATGADPSGALSSVEVAAVLDDVLAPRPTRANFRTGSLTVCTMVPMRSVPHRVVCLLGLDADAFPRTPTPLGDDVLARHPLVGERDATGEDRQLFCDAVLSATQTLVITYTGASEHTGRALPPATPVGELLDQLERSVPDVGIRSRVVTAHPLQSFDERAFVPGALLPTEDGATSAAPFSFDRAGFAGARASRRPPRPVTSPFLEQSLPDLDRDVVTLEELRTFVAHPVRTFVRSRLDLQLAYEQEPPGDDIALSVDSLEQWQIEDRLLRAVLAGADGYVAEQDVRRSGILPPGLLGDAVLERARRRASPLVALSLPLRQEPAHAVDVDVTLPDGRRVVGTVGGVRAGHGLDVVASRLLGRRLTVPWVDTLALSASGGARPFHLIGRVPGGGRAAQPGRVTLRAPDPGEALGHLSDLVDLWSAGMRAPLPLPLKTSERLADTLRRRTPEVAASFAAREWEGSFDIEGENSEPYHRLVFGADAPYSVPADLGLERLATRLWFPLLDHREDQR